jgi:hypothetical protein
VRPGRAGADRGLGEVRRGRVRVGEDVQPRPPLALRIGHAARRVRDEVGREAEQVCRLLHDRPVGEERTPLGLARKAGRRRRAEPAVGQGGGAAVGLPPIGVAERAVAEGEQQRRVPAAAPRRQQRARRALGRRRAAGRVARRRRTRLRVRLHVRVAGVDAKLPDA